MTIPDAARAASRAAITDALRALHIPTADPLGRTLADIAVNAIARAGYEVRPPSPDARLPREYGTCRGCSRKFVLTRFGRIRVHRNGADSCDGSRLYPAERMQLGRDYSLADVKDAVT